MIRNGYAAHRRVHRPFRRRGVRFSAVQNLVY
uniref:Uncharacterized protein n=1 Tax=Siphoviridae sp. ctpV36 TaxID=2827279 RepID=A0A8S5R686_9CAUD|nr:MAG TPA: hypothetical protein [Siphoviridae sp. ctpV36]